MTARLRDAAKAACDIWFCNVAADEEALEHQGEELDKAFNALRAALEEDDGEGKSCPRCKSSIKTHEYDGCQSSRGQRPHPWHEDGPYPLPTPAPHDEMGDGSPDVLRSAPDGAVSRCDGSGRLPLRIEYHHDGHTEGHRDPCPGCPACRKEGE